MTALGLVMETMLRVVGPLFFPFFLIFCKYLPSASHQVLTIFNALFCL